MSPTQSRPTLPRAIVVGSSGGIGAALERGLTSRGYSVTGLARSLIEAADRRYEPIDLMQESSIEAAASLLRDQAPYSMIVISTGLLHHCNLKPEKALRDLNRADLTQLFEINAVGPALVAKHFVPLLPRQGRCVFAALSARVGSLSENRLGGWYGYRASKAALNMIIKTLAIELARTRPEAICVGLHPGTVDTELSKPFQRNVAPDRLFLPEDAATNLLGVLDGLTAEQTGRCFAWNGTEILP